MWATDRMLMTAMVLVAVVMGGCSRPGARADGNPGVPDGLPPLAAVLDARTSSDRRAVVLVANRHLVLNRQGATAAICWDRHGKLLIGTWRGRGVWSVDVLGGPEPAYKQLYVPPPSPGFGSVPISVVGDVAASPTTDEAVISVGARLWTLDLTTGHARAITRDPALYRVVGPGGDSRPAWSPDGNYIAFYRALGDKGGLWLHDVQARREMPLLSGPYNYYFSLSWCPDSARVAYVAANMSFVAESEYHSRGVFEPGPVGVVSIEGENQELLGSEFDVRGVAWCPCGDQLAVVANKKIWLMSSDGTDRTPLSAEARQEDCPAWSEDCRRLAFVARDYEGGERKWRLMVRAMPDGPEWEVGERRRSYWAPVWGPGKGAAAG